MLSKIRRPALLGALALAVFGTADAQAGSISSIDYLSNTTFVTGTRYQGQLVAGLSGIDYDAATGTFITQRDNFISGAMTGGAGDPVAFTMKATMLPTGGYSLAFTGVNTLGGGGLNELESVRYDPKGNGLWLTSEQPHTVYHVDANGVRTQLTLDSSVNGRFTAATDNYGIEGLTFTPNGDLWVSRENALTGDNSNIIRLSQLGQDGTLQRQFAYQLDSVQAPNRPGTVIANPPGGGVGNNGVSEILALTDHSFLVMERGWDGLSATTGVSHNSIRIYEVDLSGATDVMGIQNLDGTAVFSTVSKQLIFDSESLAGVLNTYDNKIDNIEGMTFGPTLADGRRSLVLVSDNNNSNSQRKTQFIVFGVNAAAVPEPATWAMLIVGFGFIGGAMRRRDVSVRFA